MRDKVRADLSVKLVLEIQTARRLLIPIDIGGQHWALVHVGICLDLVVYSDSWLATRVGVLQG